MRSSLLKQERRPDFPIDGPARSMNCLVITCNLFLTMLQVVELYFQFIRWFPLDAADDGDRPLPLVYSQPCAYEEHGRLRDVGTRKGWSTVAAVGRNAPLSLGP